MVNNVYCEICKVNSHKNSVWKHNKSDKHINSLTYEQIDIYDDIVEILERLFKEKLVIGFFNPFHLKKPISDQYNVTVILHNLFDLNSELKVVGKYNQNFAQVHLNITVKQKSTNNEELIKQFKFKIKV